MSTSVRSLVSVTGAAIGAGLLVAGPATSALAVDGTVTPVVTDQADLPVQPTDPSVSDNGRYVAFGTAQNIYLADTTTGTTTLVSRAADGIVGNNYSYGPTVSATGKFVVYTSFASNLAPGSDPSSTKQQVFRYVIATGKTTRVSKSRDGGLPNDLSADPSISATGRYISYMSYANNVVAGDHNKAADIFRYDTTLGTTIKVSETLAGGEPNANSQQAVISPDGANIAYATLATNMGSSDTNGNIDTYTYDVAADRTALASHGTKGTAVGKTTPTGISNGGTIVSLTSTSPRLTSTDTDKDYDAFVYRARTDTVALVNPTAMVALSRGVSADGRYVLYEQWPTPPANTIDVFVLDRTANESTTLSSTGDAGLGSISTDGRFVTFISKSTNPTLGFELFLWTRTSA